MTQALSQALYQSVIICLMPVLMTSPLTVSQLTCFVKDSLELEYSSIVVTGEISNFKHHISGHRYLALKDDTSILQAVAWKGTKLPELRDGMQVVCQGKITAYKSQFQLVITSVQQYGQGALQVLFEQMKAKLQGEGLFDQKRTMPALPHTIGVIVGHNSDAEKDILKRSENRFIHKIIIRHTLVQGDAAVEQVCRAIELLQEQVQVIIIARGGGSAEDLAAFNHESVARAIFASKVPTITAIGHEADVTLADYVSDLRAPTPTASIEMLLMPVSQLTDMITDHKEALQMHATKAYATSSKALAGVRQQHLQSLQQLHKIKALSLPEIDFRTIQKSFKVPSLPSFAGIVDRKMQHLLNVKLDLTPYLKQKTYQLNQAISALENLSYTNTLSRGFAIVKDLNENVISSKEQAIEAADLTLQFQDGDLRVRVLES